MKTDRCDDCNLYPANRLDRLLSRIRFSNCFTEMFFRDLGNRLLEMCFLVLGIILKDEIKIRLDGRYLIVCIVLWTIQQDLN
jgi:hypothetical protein